MPKMTLSIDGVPIKEIKLEKERTTLGRRPYNDIVIDNLAVSGEHAVILMQGTEVVLEDLGSTNGTYVQGKPVKKHTLQHNDVVEIGKYRIQFTTEKAAQNFEKTMLVRPGSMPPPVAPPPPAPMARPALLKVMSGAAAGREVPLVKVVTTIGKPGAAVAAITKRPHGYVIHMIEGTNPPTVNGNTFGAEPIPLKHSDMLELAGTRMQFMEV